MRRLDIIDMDEVTKADVVRDAEYYYSQESRSYFADCGISYRRGYLFYGPPGTGKSSFSAALAGCLGCDIYHINLASGNINDSALHRLFLGLPRKCVVVIEDIDSAGIGREQVPQEDQARFMDPLELDLDFNPGFDQMNRKWNKSSSVAITLSGLLNAIDGNAFQEGGLLIMTSKHPDALDEALT
ncbi:bcs1 atpase [Pyrenophora tritici-repentis]|nr:bcs1 atpase [Pyrenophora tritici-repentis]KAI2474803.1 bcs1 atpase [Pyrenophora tritici-repentis]